MKRLKIVFYTDTYLPTVDGVVSSIVTTRKELEKRGHEVYIFASGRSETAKLMKTDRHLTVYKGIHFRGYPQYTVALRPQFIINIKKIRPDIIHFHTPFAMGFLAARASSSTGAKLVSTFHTLIFSEDALKTYLPKNRLAGFFARLLLIRYLRWIYRKSNAIIAPSLYVKNALRRRLKLKNQISVIPSGIEFNNRDLRFSRRDARKRLGIKENEKVVLYLGRVSPEKNLAFLIRAARLLAHKDFRLVVAGTGPYLSMGKELVRKYKLKNVTFTGFLSKEAANLYYLAADVFCNPSLFETQSLVDVEAMARGLPILVPKNTAQAEFLRAGKCGELFDRDSERDLVQKVLRIHRNGKRYSARRVAQKYFASATARNLEALYYDLLGPQKSVRG